MKVPEDVLTVARQLGDLLPDVVFVGGMVRALLVTDPAVLGPRPTRDVDLILDISSPVKFAELGERVRALGFKEDQSEGAPICRYMLKGAASDKEDLPVDFMPLDPTILGFSNVWYPDAFESPWEVETESGKLRIIGAPEFIATKLEAFASRGDNDHHHHDLEDIVVVVDGRPTLVEELKNCPREICEFIAGEVQGLLQQPGFGNALPGHLQPDAANQARLPILRTRLAAIAGLLKVPQRMQAPVAPPVPIAATLPRSAVWQPTLGGTSSINIGGVSLPAWQPARSSNIARFAYDSTSRTLTVEFKKRTVYEYYDVPAQVFEGWKSAASAGRYHHRWIRDRYRYKRLGGRGLA